MTTAAAPALQRYALWPLRAFLGLTFSFAGLQKLANPDYLDARSPTSVQASILSLRHGSPIGFLLGASAHAPVFVGVLIAVGELSVGIATVLGLWVRLAAAGGLLLSLTFFLTVSFHTRPYYYGSDIVFVFAWSVPLLAGQWPSPTLDGWIGRRAAHDPDPRRRALLLGGAAAAATAAGTAALAAATAGIGRALRPGPSADRVGGGIAPPPTVPGGGAGGQTGTPAGGGGLPGRHLAFARSVPPGSAVRFDDDSGSPAWLVHESSGGFRAFSAVCTHAGCSVLFSNGEFVCPCHGGRYSAATGAVLAGPPPAPLRQLPVTVVHGDVRLR